MKTKTQNGQSTFEYIILLAAVIAVVFVFVVQGDFGDTVTNILDGAVNEVHTLTD